MVAKRIIYALLAIGIIILISRWGDLADQLSRIGTGDLKDRPKKIVIWSNSGSPEADKRVAREWEKENPEVQIQMYFRESGRLADTIYVSFLSGSPPDMMDVSYGDMRDMVTAGMLRPMDDLLERTIKEYESRGENFFDFVLGGQDSIFRFQTNPNDPLLKRDEDGNFIYPLQAARLLHMHGKFLGFMGNSTGNQALTYNRRVFVNAGKWFEANGEADKAKKLIGENNQALPPRTWKELLEKARLITEYGKRSGEGCYGIVIQGRTSKDLMRGIEPLAATAGSRGFDFTGAKWLRDEDGNILPRQIGRYEYDSTAFVAAFNLLMRLKADGSALPGTGSRLFEDSRTRLGEGKAAMLIDGWHAALIAVERVPWAKNDIGSAPIPVPYQIKREPVMIDGQPATPDADAYARGRPILDAQGKPIPLQSLGEEKNQKEQIEDLLDIEGIGRGITYKADRDSTACITSGSQHPWEAWRWMHRNPRDEEQQKVGPNRGLLPANMEIAEHIDDPAWFPFPFQTQAWSNFLHIHKAWPQPPASRPTLVQNYKDAMHDLFHAESPQAGDSDQFAELTKDLRQRLKEYTEAVNEDLRERVLSSMEEPAQWTYPGFDPLMPEQTARAQAQAAQQNKEINQQIEELKKHLPARYQFDTRAQEIEFLSRFTTSANPWTVLMGPALLLLVAIIFVAWLKLRPQKPGEPTFKEIATQARTNWYAYLFVLPAMLMLFSFVFYSSLYQLYLSFHKGSGIAPLDAVGFEQYRTIFRDEIFWTKVLPNTALVMVVVPACHVAIGLVIASMLNLPLGINRIIRPLFFIPLAVSMAAVSVVFIGLLAGPDSAVNGILRMLGLENLPFWLGLDPVTGVHDWLGSPKTDLYAVMLVAVWHGLPYNIILLLAGLQSIDPQLYEAGKVDGAGPLQRFAHITVPELLPILIVILFNALIGAARMFGPVWILTEGGKSHSSEVVATYIFRWGFTKPPDQSPDIGYACALGMVYSLILGLLVFTNVTIIARRWKRRLAMERAAGAQELKAKGGAA